MKRGLEVILSESERAARIVRNLLTFARKRQSTRAMVDLNEIVRETLGLRAYEQRITNITVLPALASGLPQVFADGHQVKQVLLNLLMNAEQAMLGRPRARHHRDPHVARQRQVTWWCSRSTTTGPAWPRTSRGRSSTPSSPPRKWARAPGSG